MFFDFTREEIEPKLAEDGELGHIDAWANRHAGRVLRIAGLLHLAHGRGAEDPIELQTMIDADQIGIYLMAHGRAVLEAPDARVRRAMTVIAEWPDATITQQQIHRRVLHSKGTARDAAKIAAKLVELGQLEPVIALAGGPGRPPSPTFLITRKRQETQNA